MILKSQSSLVKQQQCTRLRCLIYLALRRFMVFIFLVIRTTSLVHWHLLLYKVCISIHNDIILLLYFSNICIWTKCFITLISNTLMKRLISLRCILNSKLDFQIVLRCFLRLTSATAFNNHIIRLQNAAVCVNLIMKWHSSDVNDPSENKFSSQFSVINLPSKVYFIITAAPPPHAEGMHLNGLFLCVTLLSINFWWVNNDAIKMAI